MQTYKKGIDMNKNDYIQILIITIFVILLAIFWPEHLFAADDRFLKTTDEFSTSLFTSGKKLLYALGFLGGGAKGFFTGNLGVAVTGAGLGCSLIYVGEKLMGI